MFVDRVRRYANQTCLRYKSDGRWVDLDWSEVDRWVRQIGLGLIELGFKKGDKLCLLSENRPEWAFVDLATLSIGGAVATIYATDTARQCAFIVNDSAARFVACSNNNQLEKILAEKHNLKTLEKVILFDPIKDITDKDPIVMTLGELRDLGRDSEDREAFDRRVAEVTADDDLTLIYTSGTTGEPKGAVLTHRNVMSNVEALLKVLSVEAGDSCLSFLPLSHSFERTAGHFTMLHAAVPIAYAESFDSLLQDIKEVRPTVMVGVPRMYEKMHGRVFDLLEQENFVRRTGFELALEVGRRVSKHRLEKRPIPRSLALQYYAARRLAFAEIHASLGGRIRLLASGGAPLAQEIAEFFHAVGITILEGYGLTETSPIISCNTPEALRFGTVGRPLPGVEVRIAADGEILVRGPNVMKEYFHNPEATREIIDENGWLHTGDIGEFDTQGFLKITDRKKDILVTAGGKNVAPQNIENLFKLSRFIEQINVVGDRRKFLTAVIAPAFEELEAWARENKVPFRERKDLVAKPEVIELIQREVDQANGQLARFETIKKFVLADVPFTPDNDMLTPSLKVRRKAVNTRFAREIERLYAE